MKAFQRLAFTWAFLFPQLVLPQDPPPAPIQDWEQATVELRANRALWESHNISSYSFISEMSCFGCNRFYPARLAVNDETIVSAVSPTDLMPIDIGTVTFPGYTHDLDAVYETLEELFALVEQAIENHLGTPHSGTKASNVSVEYDEVYGFPVWISADYSRGLDADGSELIISDAWSSYRVSEFKPLP